MLTSTGIIQHEPLTILGHDNPTEPSLDAEIAALEQRKQALQHQRQQRIHDLQVRIRTTRVRLSQLADIQRAEPADPHTDPGVHAAMQRFHAAARAQREFPRCFIQWPGARYEREQSTVSGYFPPAPIYDRTALAAYQAERDRLQQQCLIAQAAYSAAVRAVSDAAWAELRQRQEAAKAEAEGLSERLDQLNEQLAALTGKSSNNPV